MKQEKNSSGYFLPFIKSSVAFLLLLICVTVTVKADDQAVPPMKDFLKALAVAAKPLNGDDSAIFLSPGRDPSEKPTLTSGIEEVLGYLADFEPFSLSLAQRTPQAFTIGGTMNSKRGGMIVWCNDVFPGDFFVQRISECNNSESGGPSGFFANIFKQPWFQWSNRGFTYYPSGAGERIFALMKSSAGQSKILRLYRGTTNFESQILDLGRKLEWREPIDSKWRSRLKVSLEEIAKHAEEFLRAYEKGVTEGWATPADVETKREKWVAIVKRNEELIKASEGAKDKAAIKNFVRFALAGLLSQGEFCGLFTTPDSERAKLFSKGQVVEFNIEWETLTGLLKRGKLYVGFEKIFGGEQEDVQVEIGFLGSNDQNDTLQLADVIIHSYRRSRAEKPSVLFN
ncbi:MAG: hypothetical protein HQM10_22765 [Candidatus Riflebacteria bacterium]|nr:hypothetical protein [Candidatus Riflebacteria bacterium]